jgi:hypothetical protein
MFSMSLIIGPAEDEEFEGLTANFVRLITCGERIGNGPRSTQKFSLDGSKEFSACEWRLAASAMSQSSDENAGKTASGGRLARINRAEGDVSCRPGGNVDDSRSRCRKKNV